VWRRSQVIPEPSRRCGVSTVRFAADTSRTGWDTRCAADGEELGSAAGEGAGQSQGLGAVENPDRCDGIERETTGTSCEEAVTSKMTLALDRWCRTRRLELAPERATVTPLATVEPAATLSVEVDGELVMMGPTETSLHSWRRSRSGCR